MALPDQAAEKIGVVNVERVEKPNSISFRYAGTGHDLKIYFDTEKDLGQRLNQLANAEDIWNNIERIQARAKKEKTT